LKKGIDNTDYIKAAIEKETKRKEFHQYLNAKYGRKNTQPSTITG
jgi:hypothetical protein